MRNAFGESESFKAGWIFGLYASLATQTRYVDEVLRHGIPDNPEARDFHVGFTTARASVRAAEAHLLGAAA